jgi:predicted small integral membrane protein
MTRFDSLRLAAIVVVAINALYITLVVFGNITDFDTNRPFVEHVLAMDTTNFGGPPGEGLDEDTMWRAIESPTFERARARNLATLGLLGLVILFFGGFIAIGGEWFQMWKSVQWNGLEPAFRNSSLALFGLVLLHLRAEP